MRGTGLRKLNVTPRSKNIQSDGDSKLEPGPRIHGSALTRLLEARGAAEAGETVTATPVTDDDGRPLNTRLCSEASRNLWVDAVLTTLPP